jgi:hypothetical protein
MKVTVLDQNDDPVFMLFEDGNVMVSDSSDLATAQVRLTEALQFVSEWNKNKLRSPVPHL